ncbi:glycoside hydrolase family 18 protein [Actinoplanes utahensis]|nr:chitinase [Actinoplanes utahensis]
MRLRWMFFPILALLLAACSEPPPREKRKLLVVGYLTEWAAYDRGYRDVDAAKLSHVKYAFGKVDRGKCAVGDAWAAYRKPDGNFGQIRRMKERNPALKVVWSFGGWNGSAGFTEAAKDPAGFASSCRRLLEDPRWAGLFDGIDIDWEYPNACGKVCDSSGPGALTSLLAALRAEFGPAGLITAAIPADPGKLRAADYAGAARHVDWLAAMTYDYFGTKGPAEAPHSALTSYPGIPRETATAEATVTTLLELGVPAAKLLLGVGFYGRGWTGTEHGMEDYRVLAERCPPTGTIGGTAYARCGSQWWSYDTPATIAGKVSFARDRGLAGVFAWELSGDSADAALLTALSG